MASPPPNPPPSNSAAGGAPAPTKIGKYVIQRRIGSGGMGTVYLAMDSQLKRNVALKLLPQEKAQNPILVRRFHAEARAAAALKHDNIVTVYEAGEADGYNFIALEFIDGTDVSNIIHKRGVIPVKRSVEIITQVAKALHHASTNGFVHRDIKPANLLLRRDGVVKLADLGLARSLDEAADTGITRAGTTVGTVDYMAPEQARDSKAADVRSDLYSLGCTWYHMLTGSPPYPDGSLTNKLRAHADAPIPDPRLKNPDVPEAVIAILNRLMAKKPQGRYQSAAEFIKDLQSTNFSDDAVSEMIRAELAAEADATADTDDDLTPVVHAPRKLPDRERPPDARATAPRGPSLFAGLFKLFSSPQAARQPAPPEPAAPEPRRGPPHALPPDEPHEQLRPGRSIKLRPLDDPAPPEDQPDAAPRPRRKPATDDSFSAASDVPPAKAAPRKPAALDESAEALPYTPPTAKSAARASVRDAPSTSEEVAAPIDYTILRKGLLGLGLIVLAFLLAKLVQSYSAAVDGPVPNANPFAAQAAPQQPDPAAPQPGVPQPSVPENPAVAESPAAQPGETGTAADSLSARNPSAAADMPDQHGATGTAAQTPVAAPPREATSREQLEAKLLPAWVAEPRTPTGLVALTVGGEPGAEGNCTTLNDALDRVPATGAIITLKGRGPFALYPAHLSSRTQLVIQSQPADPAAQPLIVLLPHPGESATDGLRLEHTALELRRVHFALDAAEFAASPRFNMLNVIADDLFAERCSFSVKGRGDGEFAALVVAGRMTRGGRTPANQTRVLVSRSLFRGQRLTALAADAASSDLVLWESLMTSGMAPALRLGGAAEGGAPRSVCVCSCTVCSQQAAIEIAGDPAKPPPTQFSVIDSLVGAPAGSSQPNLVALAGWNHAEARGAVGRQLTWKSKGSVYSGWKSLLWIASEKLSTATTFKQWQALWNKDADEPAGDAAQFQPQPWPGEPIGEAAKLRLITFVPQGQAKAPAVKATDGAWPGCAVNLVPLVNIDALKSAAALAGRPQIPPGLFASGPASTTIHVDLAKDDLGKALRGRTFPDGALVVVSGSGTHKCSPIVIADSWIRLRFEHAAAGPPIVIMPRVEGRQRGGKDDAFLTIRRGGLEIVQGVFTLPASEMQSLPQWMIRAEDADLALRECRIQGPLLGNTTNKGLIQWKRTPESAVPKRPFPGKYQGYAAFSNTLLCGSGVIFDGDLRRGCVVFRNSIAASRDDIFHFDVGGVDSQIAGVVDLQQSTFSGGDALFTVAGESRAAPSTAPLTVYVDRCLFAPPLKTGPQKANPTLLVAQGPLLDPAQHQVVWWDHQNAYAEELAGFILHDNEKPPATPQRFADVWVRQWGESQVIGPLFEAGRVMLDHELPDRGKAVDAADFLVSRRSKALTLGEGGTPVGANPATMNLPDIRRAEKLAPGSKTKPAKPVKPVEPIGF